MAFNENLENKDINYLSKDFNSFKENLTEFAKTYFPSVYNDFSAASPGTMFIEIAAYVGDVLSYYMDSQLKENLLPYAKERTNIINIANTLGYRVKPSRASSTDLNVFLIIPSTSDGSPDWRYGLILQENSTFHASSGNSKFMTNRSVNFNFSSSSDPTTTTVYKIDSSTSQPSYFLLKKKVSVTAGEEKAATFVIGSDVERYRKIELSEPDVLEVMSVRDSQGNDWHEVPYMAQETVYIERRNTSAVDNLLSQNAGTVPYLLKLKKTSKRFITRTTTTNKTALIFGSGVSTSPDELIIPNPENVGLSSQEGVSKLDRAFDPSNFLQTKTYGQSPRNTTLTVKYRVGGGQSSNSPAGTITNVGTAYWGAPQADVNESLLLDVKTSLAVNNETAAMGGASGETPSEIKRNALAYFQAQNRIVTREDYLGRIYSMPGKYGNVAKAFVAPDTVIDRAAMASTLTQDTVSGLYGTTSTDSTTTNPNATNLYLLGYDMNKNLKNVNRAVKENLRIYLTPYKMLTDAINIKNGFIINIAVYFEIINLPGTNSNEVLLRCIDVVRKHFNIDLWQFGEPITINKITVKLANTEGVQSVTDVRIEDRWRSTQGYSGNKYDIGAATKNGIIYPAIDPSIFELKYPNRDIIGKITTY